MWNSPEHFDETDQPMSTWLNKDIYINMKGCLPAITQAKGDVFGATAQYELARIPVAKDNCVFIADMDEDEGVNWGYIAARRLMLYLPGYPAYEYVAGYHADAAYGAGQITYHLADYMHSYIETAYVTFYHKAPTGSITYELHFDGSSVGSVTVDSHAGHWCATRSSNLASTLQGLTLSTDSKILKIHVHGASATSTFRLAGARLDCYYGAFPAAVKG